MIWLLISINISSPVQGHNLTNTCISSSFSCCCLSLFYIELMVMFLHINDISIIMYIIWSSLLMVHFLYHLMNVFTNCSMNIDQLVFKLLKVTLVLVRKSLKFLLLGNQWTIGTVFKLLSWWKLSLWWNFFDVISNWKNTSLEWLSLLHIPDNRHCIIL
jgi:hypothetical protein